MKRKDLAIIIVVVIIAAIFSTVASKMFITAKKSGLTAEVVDPIVADFPQKDTETFKTTFSPIFNDQAINPTTLLQNNTPR